MSSINFDIAVNAINSIIALSVKAGLDHELILASVYAQHLLSDEKCDNCHMYGITFAEKLNTLMSESA